jgi:class 3 adenylate cyclase/tetratricopeptide (TPR) repeat protein
MFCDLVGSTELSSRLDPEDLGALIRIYQGHVAGAVARFGGFIARYVGDGVLIYFGWPKAGETDAEQAVHAALAAADAVAATPIQGEALRVRIGIATGLVVVGDRIDTGEAREQTAIGETPNRAARLQALAEPGRIVIDAATRRQVGDLFDCRELGAVPLKGLPEPVPVFEVRAERAGLSRFEALHPARLTPLIGREEELELLLRRWAQAKTGQGRVVLISGEPGIGKSRVLAALDERLRGETFTRTRYFCSPHHQDTPLYPVIQQLEFAAGFEREDTQAERLSKLRRVLAPTEPPMEDLALLAALLLLPSDGLPVLNLSPQRRKQRTFEALIRQVERLSQVRPLLMLFEDVHWADPSTCAVLDDLIDHLGDLRVLLVMTFRPEFRSPWAGQAGATLVTLGRLDRIDTASLALQLTIRPVLPPELLHRIVAQSDGVPLFIEELTKAVVETAAQTVAGAASTVAVPATLQASLLSRLDRMPAAKQVAQIGAVFGRDFSHAMISAVAGLPAAVLNDGLDRLVASGLVFRRGEPPEATYTFKHALVQDAAYDSLLRARRVALHAAIGDALERDAEVVATRPALLGHHFAQAGAVEKAVAYLLRAGQQSAAGSAMAEAQAHLTRGLVIAAKIADGSDRSLRQAELTLALGNIQMAVHGYASAEHGATLTEAVELCRGLGPEHGSATKLLARALFGNWTYMLHAGQLTASCATAEEFLALGRNHADPEIRAVSATAYGVSCFFLARLQEGVQTFTTAVADRGFEAHAAALADFGVDGRSMLHAQFARHLACQGFPEQAGEQARTGMERARRLQHLPTIALTLSALCTTAWILRDRSALEARSSELVRLTSEQGFAFWLARGKGYAGWAAAANGRLEEGRALLAQGLAELVRDGALLYGLHARAMLADVHTRMGQSDLALAVLDEALGICSRTGEVWIEAELHRRKGELLRTDRATAEAYYQRAIEIARSQSAKLFELRAAVGLAGLWREHGRPGDARELLAPIYAWFTEGFDTPDLAESRALVDELATASA